MNQHVFIINEKGLASSYGVGTYLSEYIKCLRKLNLKIHLVTLFCNKGPYCPHESEGIDNINIPMPKSSSLKYYYQSICATLKLYYEEIKTPFFHLNFHDSIFFIEYIRNYFNDATVLYTIHYFCWTLHLNSDINLFKSVLLKFNNNQDLSELESLVISEYQKEIELFDKVDKVICLSSETYDMLKNEYQINATKINLIPNGIEDSYTLLSEEQKNDIREYFHIKKEEKIILFVGRITALKGVYVLLDSFKKISHSHINYRLFVVGDGEINSLLNQAESYWDKITFTSKMDKKKLNQIYKIADIGIIPSYSEQCSFVCLEMMMNALPCIVSNGIGLNSIFKNDFNAIIAPIVNYQNPYSYTLNLERSILKMINNANLRSAISQTARLTYLSNFTLNHMLENYEKLFITLKVRTK